MLEANFEVELGAVFTADILPCVGTAAWQYEYFLQDHLGNNRVLFADQDGNNSIEVGEILQENHCYAFGLEMEGEWLNELVFENRYGFNGKEQDTEGEWGSSTHYDYGFRVYNPMIAKFLSVDPLAGSMAGWSPYNYVFGNPISLIDPDGRAPAKPYNDYFDKNGKYLGSDDRGDEVRIVDTEGIEGLEKL